MESARGGGGVQENEGLLEELDYEPMEDGTFWIPYAEFARQFNKLHVCRLFPPSWHQLTIKVPERESMRNESNPGILPRMLVVTVAVR